MNTDKYLDGSDSGDDQCAFVGFDADVLRFAEEAPHNDAPGGSSWLSFGSAHTGGCQMALCDGSVHTLSYEIDLEVHRRPANRGDGKPANLDE